MKLTGLDQRLEGKLKELYQRHLERTEKIDWSYHTLIPWERGRNFNTEPWSPEQVTISPELFIAVETALLTEVNLPWFTAGLTDIFRGSLEVMQDFVRTWTSEEDQHSDVLQTYLLVTRNGDPDRLHRLRKTVVRNAWTPSTKDVSSGQVTAFIGMVYTAVQELSTQAYYINVAKRADDEDPQLALILRRIAKDETLHYTFYRDAVKAHLDLTPNLIEEVADVMMSFSMPGYLMPDFKARLEIISQHANYGVGEFYKYVIAVLMDFWDVPRLQPTAPEAIKAQARLNKHVSWMARLASIADKRRATPLATTGILNGH
ncbi:MAG TPA: acyl-ACP desaturase [Chloroflexia bacterium]|nr:acyl-ACP desaturase [Chloroflexia bacterium]